MKKILLIILGILIILIVILLIRAFTYPFKKAPSVSENDLKWVKNDSAIQRLSGGIKIPTVSTGELGAFDYDPFDRFKEYLKSSYPLVYQNTENYEINTHALVFRLKGSNPALEPIVFLSHSDVVPPGDADVKNKEENVFRPDDKPLPAVTKVAEDWDFAPFSGAVANGRIYGRGTIDMKGMLFSLLESLDNIIKSGQIPQRDIYLAFGFDEEVGGQKGAVQIADYFKKKGLKFDAVYDEGGLILEKGSIKGINSDVAVIGCAEKGFLSAKIKVKGLGGHSSMPPMESAIGKAAVIMQRLEENQMKPMITPLIKGFFDNIGGSMPFANRLAISNQWLLKPLLLSQLTKNNSTNALVRTTTALTMMKGSAGPNVLSPEVEFIVNFRLLPGNSVKDVKEHIAKATEGFDVEVEEIDNTREASLVSSFNTKAYQMIESGIKQIYPDAIATPYLTIAATDAYKYQIVSNHIYRFMPVKINDPEKQSIHSTNEYISIENYMKMIHYFEYIMRNYDK
ncbi:M20/M25/M40 family metallo-hydrolase [Chryseobacterium populi]|uniref:Acetylornithine deacetylase/succinyldiaminopimelate desuccinylase-like deacylase n=1 Tax=Chryseobacterium populi TaxID=1144316 RepID=J3CE29_9FLAO|nr:M20/M25/M40 family metallo-hydrolase [Chryseobacterium populi]EJL69586.1 acetylornithine deacetylase/succinyldiaminopimelate desuccinylase-like deacylase [Chryseobacterium populi]